MTETHIKLSQNDKVLAYMREFGSITQLDAYVDLSCLRLASRISDLRAKGYNIESKVEKVKNRYGETCCVKRYYLKEKERLNPGALIPKKAYATDVDFDIRTPIDATIKPHSSVVIETGIHIEHPAGTVGMIKSKSGLNVKHNIISEGVIDCGYTGSIRVKLYNLGRKPYTVHRGDKIAQLVILPLTMIDELKIVNDLEYNERGNGGFGSTGR